MDLDLRKTLHLKLLTDTHAGLKIQSIRYKLSMQAVLEELAIRVVQEDPYIIGILKELVRSKRAKEVKALASTDADSILDHLEDLQETK